VPEVAISPVAKGLALVLAALAPPESALRASLYLKRSAETKARERLVPGPIVRPSELATGPG